MITLSASASRHSYDNMGTTHLWRPHRWGRGEFSQKWTRMDGGGVKAIMMSTVKIFLVILLHFTSQCT